MSAETPRDLLDRADRERRTAAACESIERSFRLGRRPAVKRGLFAWRTSSGGDEWRPLSGDESMALYRAAQIVRREALAEAAALDARVTVSEGPAS